MASIEFWGGLGVIGSSKILIRSGAHRVLLDIGLDIPSEANLFRPPVRERPGHELADWLRVGGAPHIPGLFDPAALLPGDPLADPVGRAQDTAVFVSHPHIDHVGLAGFVRPEIPVYAHTDAVDLLTALTGTGAGLPGGDPDWRRLTDGQVVTVGDITVECVPVDHDVPGASGYLVHTPAGSLAYSGDIRNHGRHPERSWAFARRAAGVDVLVVEGTTLSFPVPDGSFRVEADVLESFVDILASASGLVLLSLYPRDVERVVEFVKAAAGAGRRVVWPAATAAFLRRMGVPDALTWAGAGAEGVELAEVHADPAAFVVAPDVAALPDLLDLPLRAGDVYVHANGEPLGEFDPRWPVFTDWLAHFGVELRRIGCWGHASPDDLHTMVQQIAPKAVFPIHTLEPTRLYPTGGIRRVVAKYGERYDFEGNVIR
ncbi:MAG TPA: MBL fold metallo-hydrolase [Pseudonocardiaceae bacterium]|nr:MBL fold metallo-hydrolase [Pseudonocardiaceae bacterium]